MTAIFLSDVHLRDAGSVKTKLVIRFLQEVASRFEKVYILGDLFDAWPGTSAYLVRAFRPVVQSLKRLVDEGHEVHYVEGNHDFHLGEYFRDSLGIHVHPNELAETWGTRRIFMTHGDLGNPRELGYRALRRLLRSNVVHGALQVVPAPWIFRAGAKWSQLSRKYQTKKPREPQDDAAVRQIYRDTAHGLFHRGYDVVIMGHTHLPDHMTEIVAGRECRYYNTGDWVKHFTYLEFDGTDFYTRSHPVKDL